VKTQLAPTLNPSDVVVLDNCSVHHATLVSETLEECGVNVLFLPPYSPDFNPIELMWAYVKKILKKLKARTYDKLISSLNIALSGVF
jgi:transposase